MLIFFELTIPKAGSWNGKWSDEDDFYAKVVSIRNLDTVQAILNHGCYYYRFGDGRVVRIVAGKVTPEEARIIRRKTKGFCECDWMIDSIIKHGKIIRKCKGEENSYDK